MDDIDIGSRLAQVRKRAGLSQRALAKRAGITNSTISLIESNDTNTSIGALRRILAAVPIGLSEFFTIDVEETQSFVHRARDLIEIGKGPISYLQVGRSVAGKKLQMLWECYQPGADTGRIPLNHQGEECGIVISGQLEVTVDGVRKILSAGDAYSFESHRQHRFRCVGDVPARIVSACTPPSF